MMNAYRLLVLILESLVGTLAHKSLLVGCTSYFYTTYKTPLYLLLCLQISLI